MYEQPDPYLGERPPAPEPAPASAVQRRRPVLAAGAASVAVAVAVFGLAYSTGRTQRITGSGSAVAALPAIDRQGTSAPVPGPAIGSTGSASAAQQVGVVDIDTVLKYQGAAAAGTGMVLTASGEILTNNHVVSGATSITVRVVTTGKTYRASVVGTDPSQDVAVLQLQGASGLQSVHLGDSATLQVGAAVTGVGNAGGTGGTPSAATGTVLALDQPLTATDESGQNAENLTGMIETDAAIKAGDSGGPLYDAADHVVGMDTAASAARSRTAVGFAIPIERASAIAAQIEAGHASATIHLGYPGFLGVSTLASPSAPGALVQSVLAAGPAAQAGIAAGDVITAVGGTPVSSSTALRAAVAARRPGERVTVSWLDSAGQAHRAVITLAVGPPD
ncbi:MAG: septum formation initiator [Pseudonocardiales bacterium]|nr:MAG: septum formation initiator [Pseudonocardiales bacterium]